MAASDAFERRFGRKPGPATRLSALGREPRAQHGFVNTPIYRGSTVLFPTLDALTAYSAEYTYGRRGTPTTRALEEAIAALENGAKTFLAPSGLAAVAAALTAFASPGDHILVADAVYHPTRRFCDTTLKRLGVETEYYDPRHSADAAARVRANTRLIFAESPGSNTFEVQDLPALAAIARSAGLWLMADNTWASPLYCRPLDLGADVSIQSATKYITGHSDVMLGAVTVNDRAAPVMRVYHETAGLCASPEDCFLAARGLRTLSARLERHWRSGLAVAEWLRTRPEILRVLHPALPDDPGHALWRRDFTGASGLFGVVLRPAPHEALAAMLDGLTLFGMGYSWGGFESLAVPFDPRSCRTATPWMEDGWVLRLHIGLEEPEDLIADLEAGLDRFSERR
ncbi:MAG: cystathionine beta-lyase [Hyphomicrobiales bacterium]|nr:cystathionine beta-lyase [Hyphomicrobiales bacterium]